MWNDTKKALIRWNETAGERQKLQHAYLIIGVAIVLVAGISSLFDADLGHDIVKLALIAGGAFIANAFVWNLINSVIIVRITDASRPTASRKKQ